MVAESDYAIESDISGLNDIKKFVDLFYTRIQDEERLGSIFQKVAGVDWVSHLETMYSFWDSVLFGTGTYKGNPLAAHLKVNVKVKAVERSDKGLTQPDFERWIELFHETLDELFEGPNVVITKRAASRMAEHLGKVCALGYQEDPLNRVPYRSKYRKETAGLPETGDVNHGE